MSEGSTAGEGSSGSRFYWCLKHERVESDEHCGASQILGPYPTEAAARDHAAIAAARNEAWDDADDAWDRWGEDDNDND